MLKKRKAKDIKVSLEISDDSIKICETAFFEKRRALRLIYKGLSSKEDDTIAKEIDAVFSSFNISERKVLLNLPRHYVMARFLRLPSTDDNELKGMVEIESLKQMPYLNEEIIARYRVENKFENGYSNVLMAVTQAHIVKRLLNILKNARVTVEKVALGSESLFGWYSLVGNAAGRETAGNTAFINVNSGYIDIDVIQEAHLVFTRAFSYSISNPLFVNKVVDEIKKSLAIHQKSNNVTVDAIVISGAEDTSLKIQEILKNEAGIPCELLPQLGGIEADKTIEADLRTVSFVELIGLALKDEDIVINLLPQDVIEEAKRVGLKKQFVKTAVLAGAALILCLGLAAQKVFDKHRFLDALNAEIAAMEPKVAKAKKMEEDIRIMRQEIYKKPLAVDILAEVYRITPKGIVFNMLDYESGNSFVLRGNVSSLDEIISFIETLENSPYFENVKVKYTAKRTAAGSQVTDFEIICALSEVK